MRSHILAVLVGALLLAVPAYAENTVPTAQVQEKLIKTSLLTFNDANLTGNYAVMHAKLAKPFRDQFSPDKLKQGFKTFADQKADWGLIATKPPIATSESTIDKRGALILRGYFDTKPMRMNYELDFLPSEEEWKPLKLIINMKQATEG